MLRPCRRGNLFLTIAVIRPFRSHQPSTSTSYSSSRLSLSLLFAGTTAPAATVVLVHGWSASRRYFDLAIPGLVAAGCRVFAYDQRWHGDSGGSVNKDSSLSSSSDPGVCHVARLAVDLENVLDAVFADEPDLRVTAVGTSLGSAVLWSHYELFHGGGGNRGSVKSSTTQPRIHRVVFVDQAPLQNRTSDWDLGSNGCFDAATLAALQAAVRAGEDDDDESDNPNDAFARGNAEACLAMPIAPDVDSLLASETKKASKEALARLMADHTQNDWRPVVRGLDLQEALVVAGEKTKIFPVEGCLWVAQNAPRAKSVVFLGCGHWLYIERGDEFASLVARFAIGGLNDVEGGEV